MLIHFVTTSGHYKSFFAATIIEKYNQDKVNEYHGSLTKGKHLSFFIFETSAHQWVRTPKCDKIIEYSQDRDESQLYLVT